MSYMKTHQLSSTEGTHYTTALSQGEAEEEEFPGLRGDGRGEILEISVRSNQNLDWQVELWDADDNVIASHTFDSTNAIQSTIDGTVYYFSTVSDLEWAIPMTVPKDTVTVALRNKSATAKDSSGNGGLCVIFMTVKK